MDESFVCECGNDKFWFYWKSVRCTKCWNEYKRIYDEFHVTGNERIPEYWMRRYNLKENKYNSNWEKSKITYKND